MYVSSKYVTHKSLFSELIAPETEFWLNNKVALFLEYRITVFLRKWNLSVLVFLLKYGT